MENEERIQEEIELDPGKRQEWEEMKKGDAPFWTLKWGQENDIPQVELKSYLAEIVTNGRERKIYGIEYTLRNTLNKVSKSERWGTPEEIKALGERVYQEAIEADDLDSQATIAEVLFGKDSPEYKNVVKRKKEIEAEIAEKEAGIEEEERDIKISSDATLADLFEAVNRLWLQDIEVDLEAELWDNFDENLVEALLSNQSSNAKLIGLFAGYGYSKEDIEAYLPIRFI